MLSQTIKEILIGDKAESYNVITKENSTIYADITGDYNSIHFDDNYSLGKRIKGPIAHGMILAGFISGVIGSQLPGSGTLYEKQTLNFKLPVSYGESIKTVVTVTNKDIKKNRVYLKKCFNSNDELVLDGEAIVLPRKE